MMLMEKADELWKFFGDGILTNLSLFRSFKACSEAFKTCSEENNSSKKS
jgi:hypothetical protein